MRLIPAVLLALAVRSATAQTLASAGHRVAVPSAVAVRKTGPVVLDAKLDEAAWKAATPITEFRQTDPDEGKPSSERTEVRFLYDEDALYVGAKMYDSHGANGVTTRLVRRDGNFDMDYFELVIDAYHDHLSRAFLDVNPSGSKSDQIGIGTSCCDASWDPIWEVATHIDSDGWTAEIRIPFSQLRFSRDSVQTWGLQVRRFIKRNNEQDQWAWWGKTESGGPSRFGHLEGLRIPRASAGVELLPYVVSKSSSIAAAPGDPFNTHGRPTMRAGLDLKDRLTSNLTLDATINPDFGQVEVDPAVLNLSAFETFFPEKRPFFVEGAQVFNFGSFSCNFCSNVEGMSAFYSRRVGRAPTGAALALNTNPYADVPDATTIIGAAKVTGRTSNGTTLGFLNAVTGDAIARVQTSAGDRGTQKVEPLADYFVGRVKQDYLDGNLVVGGVLSGVGRSLDGQFTPRLAKHAEMYGNDLFYSWNDHMFTLRAQGAITNVSGDRQAILQRQLSSARYYQRPDGAARLDTTATSLRGAGGYVRVAKETGSWFAEAQTSTRTPGYETNDYAFMQRADYVWSGANIGNNWTKPTQWYRQMLGIVGGQSQSNYEGDVTQRQLHSYWNVTTPQFWNVSLMYINRPAVIDDHQLRGGPAVRTVGEQMGEIDVNTDSRSKLVGFASVNYDVNSRGGVSPYYGLNATYRPMPNFSVSFGPSYQHGEVYAQFVQGVADPTATAFYGTRYVVSNLTQKTLGLDTRASMTFSPTMTLEVYLQPFLASGRYWNFKEYASTRTNDTRVYGQDMGSISSTRAADGSLVYTVDPDGTGPAKGFTIADPNFSEQSLRGNAVFRWEYRPGSVLYVAWTQSRFAEGAFGNLDLARDRSALLAARPDNIFLVKASWWLTR